MPVLQKEFKDAPPHINPPLRTGEVYRVISAAPSYYNTIGQCFTVGADAKEVIWLAKPCHMGDYDNISIIERKAIEFEVCTLKQL